MTDADCPKSLLLDGDRQISYSDVGTGESGTWIHCHGIPGSREELSNLRLNLIRAGVRVIVPDRPGYGQSSQLENYDFPTHSGDLAMLADHLGLKRFSISGFSGGGIFALAATQDLGHRIDQVVLAGTPAAPLLKNPLEHVSELTANAWQAAENGPEPLASMLENITDSHQQLAEAMINAADGQERAYLQADHIMAGIQSNMKAAVAQGPTVSAIAMARDTFLITSQWPISLQSLSAPVRLIHGQKDAVVHPIHLGALKEAIPGASSEIFQDIGHYSALPMIWHLPSLDVPIV